MNLSSSAAKNAKSNMLVNVFIFIFFCTINTVFFEARVGFEPTSFIVSGYEPDDLTTSPPRNVIINIYLFLKVLQMY
jgi:hypothetical protein